MKHVLPGRYGLVSMMAMAAYRFCRVLQLNPESKNEGFDHNSVGAFLSKTAPEHIFHSMLYFWRTLLILIKIELMN
jgi:hypothetical protein